MFNCVNILKAICTFKCVNCISKAITNKVQLKSQVTYCQWYFKKKEDADKHFDKVKLCDRHYHLLHITKWNKIQPGSINFIFVLYLIKLTAKNLSCDSPLTIRFYYHPPCTVTLNFQAWCRKFFFIHCQKKLNFLNNPIIFSPLTTSSLVTTCYNTPPLQKL